MSFRLRLGHRGPLTPRSMFIDVPQALMNSESATVRRSATILIVLAGSLITTSLVRAAELTVLSPQAMRPALSVLVPKFERVSGNQVTVSYSSTSIFTKEIQDGK